MRRSLDYLRQVIDIIENLGLQHGSGMFFTVLRAIGNCSIDTIKRKKEFFKIEYSWSETRSIRCFQQIPLEEKVQSTMDFLFREVKHHRSNITSRLHLLGYSLGKRLIPRQRAEHFGRKEAQKKNCCLSSACVWSEKAFLEMYVKPCEKDAPELSNAYFTAFGEKTAA